MFAVAQKMKLTVPELANLVGISRDRINNWKYKRGHPKTDDLEKIKSWLESIEGAEVIPMPEQRPADVVELKAVVDALVDHYCQSIARLDRRSPLDVQAEVLKSAMQKLREAK